MKFNLQHEIIGWTGMSIILVAYGFNAFGVLSHTGILYAAFNLVGSAGIIYSSIYKKDYQPVILNIFWIVIAVILIARVIFGF